VILEGIGILPFFINLGYKLTVYSTPGHINTLLDLVNEIIETLRNLHKDLVEDIAFYIRRLVIYYDKKRLLGPSLSS